MRNEVRRWRERNGWSLRDLAARIPIDHNYIARVESGKQLPSDKLAKSLDRVFGTGGTISDLLGAIKAGTQQDYVEKGAVRELQAERIQVFTSSTIPTLLQTDDYARSFISLERPKSPGSTIDQAVSFRMARKRVFEREDPPSYCAVMDESALARPIGGESAMVDQILHIIKMAEKQDFSVQVIPFNHGGYWMLGGSLTLLTESSGSTIAYVESFGSGELVESTKRVVRLAEQFDSARHLALNESESLDLARKYLEEYR